MRPRVFIGCSTESISVANAVQAQLGDFFECTVWNQAQPPHGRSILESLVDLLERFDYAIFVYGADDVAEVRGERCLIARDNVHIEHGMFIGRLGAERCYFLLPKMADGSRVKVPTDLSGVIHGKYDDAVMKKTPRAGVSQFCTEVQATIEACESEWVQSEVKCIVWESATINGATAGNGTPSIAYSPSRRLEYDPTTVSYRFNKRTNEARLSYRLRMTIAGGKIFEGPSNGSGRIKDGWAFLTYEWHNESNNDAIVGICMIRKTPDKLVGYWMSPDFLSDRPGAVVFGAGATD